MDKQTFYFELSDRLIQLGVSQNYIDRHLKQFDSYFEGKTDDEICDDIERLGNLDRVAARIKRMTEKLMEQETPKTEGHVVQEEKANNSCSVILEGSDSDRPSVLEDTSITAENHVPPVISTADEGTSDHDALFDDEDIISFTPIRDDVKSSQSEDNRESITDIHEANNISLEEEIAEQEKDYHGRKRGDHSVSDPGRIVRTTLDDETVRRNTRKFWTLFSVTLPITIIVLLVTAALFAIINFVIAVLIIALVAALVAVTATGTLVSVFGLIFGIAQMMSCLPIGLYECGLAVIAGASAMFVGIILYNLAVRLLPFAAKWLSVLFKFIFRKYKELFVYLKKECIGL